MLDTTLCTHYTDLYFFELGVVVKMRALPAQCDAFPEHMLKEGAVVPWHVQDQIARSGWFGSTSSMLRLSIGSCRLRLRIDHGP